MRTTALAPKRCNTASTSGIPNPFGAPRWLLPSGPVGMLAVTAAAAVGESLTTISPRTVLSSPGRKIDCGPLISVSAVPAPRQASELLSPPLGVGTGPFGFGIGLTPFPLMRDSPRPHREAGGCASSVTRTLAVLLRRIQI